MTSANNFWQQINDRIKAFYTKNRKIYNYTGIGLVLVLGVLVYGKYFWQPKREHDAAVKLAKLQHYWSTDSFAVVVGGIKGKKMVTAPQIADDYAWTTSGNEAAIMAGLSYLQLGKWDKALKYLDKAEAEDLILGPALISAKATCYAEMDKPEKAGQYYEKAGDLGDNDHTAEYYKKAGEHFEAAKEYKSALRCYEKLKNKFGKTEVASDIDKYIYRVKGHLGELNN